jgi:tRNA pseudouridine38-40 synthase
LHQVRDDFHARFDARSRQYRYQMVTRSSPLRDRFAKRVRHDLNLDTMRKCAEMVIGTHDFKNFCKASVQKKSTICKIDYSAFRYEGHWLTYYIRGNRFLHHMVRRLVGTMVEVGIGKVSLDQFEEMLEYPEKEHQAHGISAKGLILEKVGY